MPNSLRNRVSSAGDDGTTLMELLIAMFLLSIVGGLVLTGTLLVQHGFRQVSSDSTTGGADQAATERLSRDLRQASTIQSATPTSVRFWLDSNSNYRQDPGEIITWTATTNNGQPQLCRQTDAGAKTCVSQPAGSTTTFSYDNSTLSAIRVVTVSLSHPGATAGAARTEQWKVTLRNVG